MVVCTLLHYVYSAWDDEIITILEILLLFIKKSNNSVIVI